MTSIEETELIAQASRVDFGNQPALTELGFTADPYDWGHTPGGLAWADYPSKSHQCAIGAEWDAAGTLTGILLTTDPDDDGNGGLDPLKVEGPYLAHWSAIIAAALPAVALRPNPDQQIGMYR